MAFFAVSLVGCDELVGSTINDEEMEDIFSTESENDSTATKEQLEVMGVEFMPGYKRFKMFVSIKEDLGPYALTDTNQVVIKATEYIGGVPNHSSSKPILKLVKNTVGEAITKNSMKALVLVDLDQPQTVVNNELKAVREIRTVFRQNLYVAFMYDQSVSETMQASDYVLDSRFVSTQNTRKLLYRSILTKKKEIEDRVGVWADAKKVSMVVFSNEQVYDDDDEPFDIDHFTLEEEMVKPDTVLNTSFFTVSSVYFSEAEDNGDSDDQASSVLKVMTKNCGGIYEKQFSWSELKESIMGMKSEEIIANEYDFENPDGKVYSGISHKMVIELFAKDDGHLIGTATTDILLGVAYNPVIVNGGNNFVVFLQGVAIGLFVILLIYLVFQLLIPYINYRLFLKKYVVRYLPGNMSVGNIAVPDTCYYCKGHFETGEEIVVKCEHVMHKDCWDENQYHCPEYGRHCDKGSHYYNHVNLFDPQNALYHKRWIIVSVLAALVAWGLYVFMILEFDQTTPTLVAKMVEAKITEVGNYAVFNDSDSNLGYLPLFGMCLGGCLTLFLSLLTDRIHFYLRRFIDLCLRVIVVSVASYFLFLLSESVTRAFDMNPWLALINWIPMSIMTLLVAFVSTADTKIHLRKYILLIAIVLGGLSLYVWSFFFRGIMMLDIRVLLLFSCIFYCVGVGLAVAQMAPKSEHYFLNVKGDVKEIDIALFKWFINNPDEVVTIGKSIDCSLQMTWDIKGQVAPVHANLRLTNMGIRLTALEEGVMVGGKMLHPGNSRLLFHNNQFTIGDTTFTYLERDI
jgi:hypothetical protein